MQINNVNLVGYLTFDIGQSNVWRLFHPHSFVQETSKHGQISILFCIVGKKGSPYQFACDTSTGYNRYSCPSAEMRESISIRVKYHGSEIFLATNINLHLTYLILQNVNRWFHNHPFRLPKFPTVCLLGVQLLSIRYPVMGIFSAAACV